MSTPAYELDAVEANALGRESRLQRLGSSARIATIAIGGAFLAAAFVFAAVFDSARSAPPLLVALFVVVYALVTQIEFEFGPGAAVPTQLILVPMLFVLPLDLVPFCVAAGLLLGSAIEHRRLQIPLERSAIQLGNSWHALGAVLVLAALGEPSAGFVYAAALAAQFAFDFAATAPLTRVAHGVPLRRFGAMAAWVYLVDAALAPVAVALALAGTYAWLLVLPLVGLLAYFARERRVRIDHALELSSAYRGTAFLLGDVVEADDAYTGSHSRHVVDLVLAVSDRLGLDPRERRRAEFTALLHDVGKIRIPAEIINKPSKLDEAEWELMKTHTVEGERMLEQVGGLLGDVGHLVRSCHERWDGAGYPDGLAGERIPLVARIVCCCDAYSAMTTDRPYRAARTQEEALDELRRCAGTQFDPAVVDALASVAG